MSPPVDLERERAARKVERTPRETLLAALVALDRGDMPVDRLIVLGLTPDDDEIGPALHVVRSKMSLVEVLGLLALALEDRARPE